VRAHGNSRAYDHDQNPLRRATRNAPIVCLVERRGAGVFGGAALARASFTGGECNLAGDHELERDGAVSEAVEGSTTKEFFETYLERVLWLSPLERSTARRALRLPNIGPTAIERRSRYPVNKPRALAS
jgi:hypothetical protein